MQTSHELRLGVRQVIAAKGVGRTAVLDCASRAGLTAEIATLQGSEEALKQTVAEMKLGTTFEVPSLVTHWRAWQDSNPRPLGS